MKKRIVWITADYFIDVDILLVPYIQENYSDWQVDWYVLKTANNIPLPEDKVTKIFPVKYRGKDPRIILSYMKAFREMRLKDADLIYSDFVGVPYYFPLLHNLYKKKIVVHAAHNVKPYDVWPNALIQYVKYVFTHNKHFQIFSKEQLNYAEKTYKGNDYFYCPMTIKSYGEVRTNNYDVNTDKLNLLFFGNVIDNKRLDLLIETIKELPQNVKDKLHLTIAGNNKNKEKYNALIGNEKCISAFFKRIDDEEVPELFVKHDFLMLTYEAVAQSGPHMIAYNYNLPVIASDISGFSERVEDGDNGLLFKVNDKQSLKDAILRAVNMNQNEYTSMKANLYLYTQKNHSVESAAKRYMEYFQKHV